MKYTINHEFVSISSQTATHRIILIHGWGADADDLLNLGKEITEIVLSLTKLTNDENKLIKNLDQKNMRRFLVSMAQDIRVVIIKLADRLHNVETLEYLDLEKRKKIAKETLSIHAPLAQKIGMNDLKWRLEDESFKHLMPDKFK